MHNFKFFLDNKQKSEKILYACFSNTINTILIQATNILPTPLPNLDYSNSPLKGLSASVFFVVIVFEGPLLRFTEV